MTILTELPGVQNSTEDIKAFLKAYDDFADALFRHCYFRTYSRERAKDLVQDTFIKTWEYIAEGNHVENLRAFLYKVATRLLIDESRKKKQISLDALLEKGFEPDVTSSGLEGIHNRLDGRKLIPLLGMLDEKYRVAVTMRYVDDFSPKEIAYVLGESENTVSVRIHRGIAHLRELARNELQQL